ncbi:protein-glutamate methylesterase/protein-glutamine glutaminase [Orenia marismortui]|uniref:protein-glutamate methylesterase/protein-glutamine glutaminase n=1 Tax=Orenia marismortui TaxID=46469 RepID=UPI00035FF92C|nr:chemotaxis response regulator protein-glutamate methylesterase [Orenia marismortui]
MSKKVRVLIVDDSPVVRQLLKSTVERSPNLEVVGTARDPFLAVKKIKKLSPDILTLDVEMPRMNGLEFLKRLMIAHPLPVVMVSTLTSQGSQVTLKALELGAVDFVAKPNLAKREMRIEFQRELLDKLAVAAKVEVRKLKGYNISTNSKANAPIKIKKKVKNRIIAIGASTGGVRALRQILPQMPDDIPGVVIIQHMPKEFTKTFAENLNQISKIKVKEAEDGDQILAGQALVAPGGYHLEVKKRRAGYYVKLLRGAKVNYQRPAVDVSFNSLAQLADSSVIAVLLTGMGSDGAKGLRRIKEVGGYTLVQNQESSTIFGMPKRAIEIGAATEIVALNQIVEKIISYLND